MLAKDYPFSHYPAIGLNIPSAFLPSNIRNDLSNSRPILHNIDISSNANIDAILQVHRRKMSRRAANRKSAQLSRARKKVK
jgi:hypothetical protein